MEEAEETPEVAERGQPEGRGRLLLVRARRAISGVRLRRARVRDAPRVQLRLRRRLHRPQVRAALPGLARRWPVRDVAVAAAAAVGAQLSNPARLVAVVAAAVAVVAAVAVPVRSSWKRLRRSVARSMSCG